MSKDHPRTHDENRYRVCLLCFNKKGTLVNIGDVMQVKIKSIFNKYDYSNECVPCVICESCRKNIYRFNSASDSVEQIDFSQYRLKDSVKLNTSVICDCQFCTIAKQNGMKVSPTRKVFFKKSKQVENVRIEKVSEKVNEVEKKCLKCFSIIAKGKAHDCKPTNRVNNLKDSIEKSLDPKEKEQLTSSLLKTMACNTNESKKYAKTLTLSQLKTGKKLSVTVGKNRRANKLNQSLLTIDDFKKIQLSYNLSLNTAIGIAKSFRVSTNNRKIIEPGLKENLILANHAVDMFFDVKTFDFINKKANVISNVADTVVYCNNVEGFIEYIKRSRRGIDDPFLKFGIDKGKQYLKVCLSIQSNAKSQIASEEKNKRQSFKDGVAAKKFKDSGVKKIFIIAAARCAQENYENVLQLWSELKINNFKGTIATDLKLANIIVGIMSHSSTYPCTWCYADDLDKVATYRTVGNILQNYLNWDAYGRKKNQAKDFKNCIYPPIVQTDEDQLILDILPPPELHLMLGVVNKIFDEMLKKCEKIASKWAKLCHVEREITHGSPAFKGNSCKILLSKVDLLRSISTIDSLKFVDAFQNFNKVVESCFSANLDPNYLKYIAEFRKSYLDLEISITPKVHAVFFHVGEFCSRVKRGLAFFSEQSLESVHSDFAAFWENRKVSHNNPDFGNRLLSAICAYNALHA